MTDEHADSGRVSNDGYQMAARIAQRLREAGLKSQILNLMPADTTVLRRDRIVIILAFTLLTALAWSYLLWLAADMGMGGMDMTGSMEFAFVFAMWTVMMVGMMTPSVVPMILVYARVGRHSGPQSTPFAATVWFAAGYFVVWIAFALLATLVHWAFERTALLDFAMAGTSNVVGGLLFIAAGSYQWTRAKDLCLTQCQKPFAFLMHHGGFRHAAPGSLILGLRHGAYCVGCCWALMTLLLVGGAMNMLW